MVDRGGFGIKERKYICTKERRVKSGDNLVISQCTGSKI